MCLSLLCLQLFTLSSSLSAEGATVDNPDDLEEQNNDPQPFPFRRMKIEMVRRPQEIQEPQRSSTSSSTSNLLLSDASEVKIDSTILELGSAVAHHTINIDASLGPPYRKTSAFTKLIGKLALKRKRKSLQYSYGPVLLPSTAFPTL